ncbi:MULTISPECIES: Pycsar system effector family protein [Pseudofrankia]|uniref:Pycsar system effector family protein n=1 Tax=Pseudofrankia TaxID=2994363 RepID=UPI001042311B|nr:MULTISPECIES: Pycsar system effector family protein [Pseudofrankia]
MASDMQDRNLNVAEATLTGTLDRCDNKASFLLALTGAAVTVVLSNLPKAIHHTVALSIYISGIGAWATAIIFLLLAVRPHLKNDDGASWPHWSRLSSADIRERMTEDRRSARIRVLSRMAHHKFFFIRWAIDLILTGIGLMIVATLCIAVS